MSIRIKSGRCFAITSSACSPFSALVISIADDLPIIRLVLDDQNALAHAASACRSMITGSVKAHVEREQTDNFATRSAAAVLGVPLASGSASQ
jgi:hypothetical protein